MRRIMSELFRSQQRQLLRAPDDLFKSLVRSGQAPHGLCRCCGTSCEALGDLPRPALCVDLLIFAQESHRRLTDAELAQLHDHQTMWRRDLERLRSRLARITIEPPTRVQ